MKIRDDDADEKKKRKKMNETICLYFWFLNLSIDVAAKKVSRKNVLQQKISIGKRHY